MTGYNSGGLPRARCSPSRSRDLTDNRAPTGMSAFESGFLWSSAYSVESFTHLTNTRLWPGIASNSLQMFRIISTTPTSRC